MAISKGNFSCDEIDQRCGCPPDYMRFDQITKTWFCSFCGQGMHLPVCDDDSPFYMPE